jgi:phosphoglycolate phosphatase
VTQYQLILFDLDGTLTDPKPGITRSVAFALAHFGITVDDLDSLTPYIGPPLLESFERFHALDATQAREALGHYRAYFAETGLYENAVYPGIPELLSALLAARRTLVVATSKPAIYASRILAHFGLADYFAAVAGSDLAQSRAAKDLIIADALAGHAEIPSDAVVMVGDREHDIDGARENGITAIAVAYGYGSLDELTAAQPAALAHTVEELRALLLG